MYVSAISRRLLGGMSTPMTRGMLGWLRLLLLCSLCCGWAARQALATLTLLVARLRADDAHGAPTSDDLAVRAHAANAAAYFHESSRFRRSPRQMMRPLVRS